MWCAFLCRWMPARTLVWQAGRLGRRRGGPWGQHSGASRKANPRATRRPMDVYGIDFLLLLLLLLPCLLLINVYVLSGAAAFLSSSFFFPGGWVLLSFPGVMCHPRSTTAHHYPLQNRTVALPGPFQPPPFSCHCAGFLLPPTPTSEGNKKRGPACAGLHTPSPRLAAPRLTPLFSARPSSPVSLCVYFLSSLLLLPPPPLLLLILLPASRSLSRSLFFFFPFLLLSGCSSWSRRAGPPWARAAASWGAPRRPPGPGSSPRRP